MVFDRKAYNKEYCKKWYQENKELTKERSAKWAKDNPKKAQASKNKHREKNKEKHNNQCYDYNKKEFVQMFRRETAKPRSFLVVNFTNKDGLYMNSDFETIRTN